MATTHNDSQQVATLRGVSINNGYVQVVGYTAAGEHYTVVVTAGPSNVCRVSGTVDCVPFESVSVEGDAYAAPTWFAAVEAALGTPVRFDGSDVMARMIDECGGAYVPQSAPGNPADAVHAAVKSLPGVESTLARSGTDAATAVVECEGLTVTVSPWDTDPASGWGASFDATGHDPVPVHLTADDSVGRVVDLITRWLARTACNLCERTECTCSATHTDCPDCGERVEMDGLKPIHDSTGDASCPAGPVVTVWHGGAPFEPVRTDDAASALLDRLAFHEPDMPATVYGHVDHVYAVDGWSAHVDRFDGSECVVCGDHSDYCSGHGGDGPAAVVDMLATRYPLRPYYAREDDAVAGVELPGAAEGTRVRVRAVTSERLYRVRVTVGESVLAEEYADESPYDLASVILSVTGADPREP